MSLINNMLAGLEDRQAYMSEGRDIVLDGLTSVNDDTFHKSRKRSPVKLTAILLLTLALFLSAYMYRKYLDFEVQAPPAHSAADGQVNQPVIDNKAMEHAATAEMENEPSPPPSMPAAHSIALKMDYSITGAELVKPAPVQQTVKLAGAVNNEPGRAAAIKPSVLAFAINSNDETGSLVDVKLNENSDYRVYTLTKPYRVAIELDKFFSLPDEIPEVFKHGLVSKIRGHHIYNNNRTLIVLDLTEKGKIKNSEMKSINGGYELTINILSAGNVSANKDAGGDNDTVGAEMPAAAEESVKPGESKLSVTKNNSTPEQLLSRGVNDYQKGKIRDGLEQISRALELQPGHIQARSTLVNLLIEQQNIPLALNILDEGIALLPQQFDWRELKAKLLVKLNKNSDAIEALIHAGPDINSNPDYYAFLAALLQQQGRDAEAVNYYQKAVNVRGDNGVWWMGLGISLERAGNSEQAKNAYTYAARDDALSPDIRDYIKNRLLILSQ